MRTLRDASILAEHQQAAVEQLSIRLAALGGAILADEPGLGKSYVAAALAHREQRRGATVELIVPASLIGQWNDTLRDFHVQAAVISHDRLLTDPRIATVERRLLIVDEAHAFRNPATLRYQALARRSVGARLLLVTATPVCNSARDLESLIRLIVPDDALMEKGLPSIDRAFQLPDAPSLDRVVAELVVRRGQSVLPAALQFGALERTVIRQPAISAEVSALIFALQFPLVAETALLRRFLWRRLESSEAALLESIRRQRRFYERALECMRSGRTLPKRAYRDAFGHEEDAAAIQTVLFWEVFVPNDTAGSAEEIQSEMARLDALRDAVTNAPSGKLHQLLSIINRSADPMLIFTGWSASASAIFAMLRPHRRAVLATGRKRACAAAAIESFRAGTADVLVSTDLAAEGLNLQRAGMVVHYDLPWNPVKLAQRNGRAHRIGQKRDFVRAIYFTPDDDRAGVMEKIVKKTRVSKRLLRVQALTDDCAKVDATLRPRVQRDAAVVSFVAALKKAGWYAPDLLDRRHKAGVEQLLAAMSREHIDESRLRDLEALLALEPWALSRPFRFTNL